ncbi:uncharacterized protein G6M90_00g064530 [Metarhizium brunneum]|uniref:Uncharacterized protein n=1 Tax=Metarhizium brunneum TaxID=500148 RepID=A0A7D5UXW4_9HYPO
MLRSGSGPTTAGLAGIYTAATRDLIRGEASLAALSSCIYPLHWRKHLPYWVPDYSVAVANPVPRSFCADRALEYVPPETTPDDATSSLLRVRGYFIGRASAVGGRSGTRAQREARV